jgi:hydrogenase nickel incorporation protein HypA/HybF
MHEYSLAHSLLQGLLEHLEREPVSGRVRKVHVRQGELLILSQQALKEAWHILTERTPLAGSELEIERVEVRVRCRSCGYRGPVPRVEGEGWHFQAPVLSCPRCGGRVEIEEGRELAIIALTVEEAPAGEVDPCDS